jgi:hypothetical protein
MPVYPNMRFFAVMKDIGPFFLRSKLLTILVSLLSICSCMESGWAATGQLELNVIDKDTGRPITCRMHLTGPNGNKPRKVEKAPFWQDHFVFPGNILLRVPLGNYNFVLERGLEYLNVDGHFAINTFADDSKQVELRRFVDMSAEGWWSGDLDVHRPVNDTELLMSADDLHVAEVISWTNEKSQWGGKTQPKQTVLRFDGDRYSDLMGGEISRPGGEVLIFHLTAPQKIPVVEGEYPPLTKIVSDIKERENIWIDVTRPFWWDMPLMVAMGQADSIQIAHSDICRESVISHDTGVKPRDKIHYPNPYGNPQWSQYIYFQLLECGVRIPPSAGSGSGVAPNPVGYNRMYVYVDGDFSYEKWWESFRAGQVVITNGPLMRPTVNGALPGHVFRAAQGTELDFEIGLTLSIRDPVSYLEIIKDGQVAHAVPFDEYKKSGKLPALHFDHSGWFLIRATTDVGKTYRFAMTAPYYVEIGPQPRISKKAAQFFLDWVYERAKQIKLNNPEQQDEVITLHRKARDFWREIVSKANAD